MEYIKDYKWLLTPTNVAMGTVATLSMAAASYYMSSGPKPLEPIDFNHQSIKLPVKKTALSLSLYSLIINLLIRNCCYFPDSFDQDQTAQTLDKHCPIFITFCPKTLSEFEFIADL